MYLQILKGDMNRSIEVLQNIMENAIKYGNGSGLSLYICRQIMRKMNGEIFTEIKNGAMYVTTVFRKMI